MPLRKVARMLERRPPEAPKNFMDELLTLAEAIRFGYAETLAKWPVLDPPRALLYTALAAVTDKGKKTAAIECGESDCVQLKDPEILKELYELKKCLTRTMLFSQKRFRSILFAAGFVKEDVLLKKRRARILKPAFTVMRDIESKCLFVFIRGTRSLRDTLTDAIGAPVSFNHFICSDGKLRRDKLVSGHAHRGMVSAADWIKKRCTPILLEALSEYPGFQIKIVGHSLGGGTAALLTYMLRENKEFSSCTCVTFGPAACMTSKLAEFGKAFITSIINGHDMVPTLSAASVHDFISEGRIKRKKFLKAARHVIGSRLSFGSTANKATADHAVTRDTQVVKKNKHRPLLSWFRRARKNNKSDNLAEASQSSQSSCKSVLAEELITESTSDEDGSNSSSEGSDHDGDTDEEEQMISAVQNITTPTVYDELLNELKELELEALDSNPTNYAQEKEGAKTKDTTEEEINDQVVDTEGSGGGAVTSDNLDGHLYPPGRILHFVPAPLNSNSNHNDPYDDKYIYLYEMPRQRYGKLRLSKMMILDHLMKKYLKVLQQFINQLEKEKSHYGGS